MELTKQQEGWLLLAKKKQDLFKELEGAELQVQEILKDYDNLKLEQLQEKIKEAKAIAVISKDQRLQFTQFIQKKIFEPAMEYEKRNESLISSAAAKETQLRKVAVEEQELVNKRLKEVQLFKTHCINEQNRIAVEYRKNLQALITECYVTALEEKMEYQQVIDHIRSYENKMQEVALGLLNKYNRVILTDKEAIEIYAEVQKYDKEVDLKMYIKHLQDEAFVMYEEDLQNAERAIEAQKESTAALMQADKEEWELSSATNVLVAQATPLELTGGVKVKKQNKIILENSEKFALKVMTTFIQNWPQAKEKLGVKTWTKLVEPFVKALDKMDKQFEGFKYEEICK